MKRKIMLAVAASVVALLPVMAQAANKLIVKDSTGTTDKMVVTDTGSVGINISNPTYKFHMVGSGDPSTAAALISNPGRATNYLPTDSGGFSFMRNNDSSINGGLPQANDRLGYFGFGSYIGTGNKWLTMVTAYAEANATASAAPTYLTFGTSTALNSIERMRITSIGNVGIGTTTPGQKLEVNGGVKLNTSTAKPTCSSTVRGTLWFTQGASGIADTLEVCSKDASNNYAWHSLF